MYLITLHYQYVIPFFRRCKSYLAEKIFSKLSVVIYNVKVSLRVNIMISVIQ